MMRAWLIGLLRLRGRAFLAAAAGVAVAVALIALLGIFIANSSATMTARAVTAVAPDWQVALQGTTDAEAAVAAVTDVAPGSRVQIVNYADIESLSAATGGTTQTTGAGKAV